MATVPYAHLFKRRPYVPQTPFPPRMVRCSQNPGSQLAGSIIEECSCCIAAAPKLVGRENCAGLYGGLEGFPLHSPHVFLPFCTIDWALESFNFNWHCGTASSWYCSAPQDPELNSKCLLKKFTCYLSHNLVPLKLTRLSLKMINTVPMQLTQLTRP